MLFASSASPYETRETAAMRRDARQLKLYEPSKLRNVRHRICSPGRRPSSSCEGEMGSAFVTMLKWQARRGVFLFVIRLGTDGGMPKIFCGQLT